MGDLSLTSYSPETEGGAGCVFGELWSKWESLTHMISTLKGGGHRECRVLVVWCVEKGRVEGREEEGRRKERKNTKVEGGKEGWKGKIKQDR